MKKVDGINGRKFLIGVFVAYFFTFFFSYCYFMVASPIIIGNAIVGMPDEASSSQIIDPALIKTFSILGIVIALIVFLYVIPKFIYKRRTKRKKTVNRKYSAFRNL